MCGLVYDQENVVIKETICTSYEAYKELNKDAKNYRDLLTDQAFDPKTSVFLLNDPKRPYLFKNKWYKVKEDD